MPAQVSTTVTEVMQAVKDEHPLFGKKWHPAGPAMRMLDRYQKSLFQKIADLKQDAVVSTQNILLPLAVFADGAALDPHILIHGGDINFVDSDVEREPLDFVQFAERLARNYLKAAYIRVGTLFLLGRAEDWTDIASIDIRYFPQPAEITAVGQDFDLPGDPLDVLTAKTAHWAAKRLPQTAGVDVMGFAAEWVAAEQRYLDQATGRRRATVGRTREVW
jgi:hypothetical protein